MIDLLIEGFRSTALPCTLAVVVPGLIALLASRGAAFFALIGHVLVTGVAAWARFSGFGPAELEGAALFGSAGLVLAGALIAWTAETPSEPWRAGVGGGLIGVVTAWSWQPCVGQHLGDVLTDIGRSATPNLLPMVTYIVGTSLLLIVLALVPIAIPATSSIRDSALARHAGLVLGVALTGLLAVGAYDDLVDQLLRISSW